MKYKYLKILILANIFFQVFLLKSYANEHITTQHHANNVNYNIIENDINSEVLDMTSCIIHEEFKKLKIPKVGFNSPLGIIRSNSNPYVGDNIKNTINGFPLYALRFPGGTIANFFDWKSMSVDKKWVTDIKNHNMAKTLSFYSQASENTEPFEQFISFCEMYNIQPFIVLNMYTQSIKKIIKNIKYIKTIFAKDIFWELGNELSENNYENCIDIQGGWNAKIYYNKSDKISKYIKKLYPDDGIGIVGKEIGSQRIPINGINKNYMINKFDNNWDKKISEINNNEAIIYHPYILINKKKLKNFIDKNNNQRGTKKDFEKKLEEYIWKWVFASVQEIPKLYLLKHNKYYSKKPIWLTEIGMLGLGDENSKTNTGNDKFINALFQVSYFISWVKYADKVDSIMFHQLKIGKGSSSVRYNDLSLTSNGLAYFLINEILKDAKYISVINIISKYKYSGVAQYKKTDINPLSCLYSFNYNNKKRMIIVNSGQNKYRLIIPFTKMKFFTIGNNLKFKVSKGDFYNFDDFLISTSETNKVEIKPYSITMVFE